MLFARATSSPEEHHPKLASNRIFPLTTGRAFIGWRMTGRNLIIASSTTPTAFDTATLVLKAKP